MRVEDDTKSRTRNLQTVILRLDRRTRPNQANARLKSSQLGLAFSSRRSSRYDSRVLKALLAMDGVDNPIEWLVLHQQLQSVFLREPFNVSGPMLSHAPGEIVGRAGIESAIGPVRHDVDVERHAVEPSAGSSGQAGG